MNVKIGKPGLIGEGAPIWCKNGGVVTWEKDTCNLKGDE